MKGSRATIPGLLLALSVAACGTMPAPSASSDRSVVLSGETYSEARFGEITSWECSGFEDDTGKVVELGKFNNPNNPNMGFISHNGTGSGDLAYYDHIGLDHRWDWVLDNILHYTFILKPDGIGLFYDFSHSRDGESLSPEEILICSLLVEPAQSDQTASQSQAL